MVDLADRAQLVIDADLEGALAARRKVNARGGGRADCVDCGDPIPASRLAVVPNATRCLPCQALFEGP